MLCRNLSDTFSVTIEISCRSVVIHKSFLSLFPSPPYPAESTPKISLCGTNSWPRYCTSIYPEFLISSTWTPQFGLVCSELPTNLMQESPLWEPQKPEHYFTAVVFLSLLDTTGAFVHPWPSSLLVTFLTSSRHPFRIPTIPALPGSSPVALQLTKTGERSGMPMDNRALERLSSVSTGVPSTLQYPLSCFPCVSWEQGWHKVLLELIPPKGVSESAVTGQAGLGGCTPVFIQALIGVHRLCPFLVHLFYKTG